MAIPGKAASSQPIIVVFDIEFHGLKLSKQNRAGLCEHLSGQIASKGLFRIVPQANLKQRLLDQKKRSYKKCFDQACQIELGRELAAEKTLATKIIKLGTKCTVSTTVFDLKTAATDRAASVRGECHLDGLVESVNKAVEDLGSRQTPDQTSQAEEGTEDEAVDLTKDPELVAKAKADEAACNSGDGKACLEYAQSLEMGFGVAADEYSSREYKKEACEKGAPLGCVRMSIYNRGSGNTGQAVYFDKKALALFEAECQQDNYESCTRASEYYGDESYYGIPEDKKKEVELLRKACGGDHLDGCHKLAVCYKYGSGVEKNISKAIELWDKACRLGDTVRCGYAEEARMRLREETK